jgi:hypothetical protein
MPRGARLDVPGTLHHVMVRGIEGNSIVADDEESAVFRFADGEGRCGNLHEHLMHA